MDVFLVHDGGAPCFAWVADSITTEGRTHVEHRSVARLPCCSTDGRGQTKAGAPLRRRFFVPSRCHYPFSILLHIPLGHNYLRCMSPIFQSSLEYRVEEFEFVAPPSCPRSPGFGPGNIPLHAARAFFLRFILDLFADEAEDEGGHSRTST